MSTEEDYYDPRTDLKQPVETGQVYVDDRTGDELVVEYVGDVILLSDHGDASNNRWMGHRLELRDAFERSVGSGRFDLDQDASGKRTTSGKMRKLKSLLERFEEEGGRKANHKAAAIEEAIDLLEHGGHPDDNELIDYDEIRGIGQTTADNLRANGFAVKKDVREAEDAELLAVSGMGEGNLSNLRAHVEVNE